MHVHAQTRHAFHTSDYGEMCEGIYLRNRLMCCAHCRQPFRETHLHLRCCALLLRETRALNTPRKVQAPISQAEDGARKKQHFCQGCGTPAQTCPCCRSQALCDSNSTEREGARVHKRAVWPCLARIWCQRRVFSEDETLSVKSTKSVMSETNTFEVQFSRNICVATKKPQHHGEWRRRRRQWFFGFS